MPTIKRNRSRSAAKLSRGGAPACPMPPRPKMRPQDRELLLDCAAQLDFGAAMMEELLQYPLPGRAERTLACMNALRGLGLRVRGATEKK